MKSSQIVISKGQLAFFTLIVLCVLMVSVMRYSGGNCNNCSILDDAFQTRGLSLECVPKKSPDEQKLDETLKRLEGPQTAWDNPELVQVVKGLIDNPRPFLTKFSLPLTQTPQAKEVDSLFKQKTGGFFIECGALD